MPVNNKPAMPNSISLAITACTNIAMPMPKRKNQKKFQLDKIDCFIVIFLFVTHIPRCTAYKRLSLTQQAVVSFFGITQ